MKKTISAVVAAAVAVAVSFAVQATVITIPENGTFVMGGTGDDSNNKRSNYIVFEPGSTLVMTAINNTVSVWTSLIATNGSATVRVEDATIPITFQMHVFAYGNGSLTMEGMENPRFGHESNRPVIHLENLLLGDGVGEVLIYSGVSVLSFPKQCEWKYASGFDGLLRFMGENMFPGQEVVELPEKGFFQLCNPAAFSAGQTIRANGRRLNIAPLMTPDPDEGIVNVFREGDTTKLRITEGCEYVCNVELYSTAYLTFTNSVPVTFSGSVSGYGSGCGNIVMSGYNGTCAQVTLGGDNSGFTGTVSSSIAGQELVLAHTNAAVNAVIDMSAISSLSGAEGVSPLKIGAITGGESTSDAVLRVPAGQTVKAGTVSDYLAVRGAGPGEGSAVDIAELSPGAVLDDDASAVVTFGGLARPENSVSGTVTEGESRIIAMPGEDGFDATALGYLHIPSYDIPDGIRIASGTNTVTLCAGAGTEGVIPSGEGKSFSVAGEGSFRLERFLEAERASVGWWFDFSRTNTMFRIGEGTCEDYLDRKYLDQQLIERVVDWRYPDADRSLWNRRLYYSASELRIADTVYPYISSSTQNGLNCIAMNSSLRRLPFSNGKGYNNFASCEAHLVVMVFGAQDGGGYAMLGTTDGAFGRTGTTVAHGMTTNTAHAIWQDGTPVTDPPAVPFKSGWQVISVDLDGLAFNGLGMTKDLNSERGGQRYGEVMIFTNEVSERVRLEAERYLAEKWGLASQYSAEATARLEELRAENRVRISGAGTAATVIATGDRTVELGGNFSGTVNLQGGTVIIPDKALPYTEADIPSDGRLYWVDPEHRNDLVLIKDIYGESYTGSISNEVRYITDRGAEGLVPGGPVLYAASARRPTAVRQSRGLGPVRTWLDFNDYNDEMLNGNCLRFTPYPSDAETQYLFTNGYLKTGIELYEMPIRTAFVVQDSVRGGGNPLAQNINCTAPTRRRATGDWTEPIWLENTPAEFADGENRLNSQIRDHSLGFLGQPEVFALRATAAYNAPIVGCYKNSEGELRMGELIGEMILFGTELADDVVKGIEAYLMGKWIGRLPDGYADLRNATVAGTGTVQVATSVQMPKIDAAFEGTVSVAEGGAFTMTVDPDALTVKGAMVCPEAVLNLPAVCSITLDFTRRPSGSEAPRDYVLVDAEAVNAVSGTEGVAWTLSTGENAPVKGVFITSGTRILFRHLQPGFAISVR